MVKSALKAAGAGRGQSAQNTSEVPIRSRATSNNAMRDPHASLELFGSREEIEAAQAAAVTSPYAGNNRPAQRGFTDILGDNPDGSHALSTMSPRKAGSDQQKQQRGFADILGDEPTPASYQHHQRTMSPAKAGFSKNYQPMRLFDGQEDVDQETPKGKTGQQYIRPNPGKYSHFDFADGSDPADAPERGVSFDELPKSKHDSQWSFDDFVTPSKPIPSRGIRAQDVRHWNTEETDDTPEQPHGKGRRDAETQIELQDDGESEPRPLGRPRGSTHNEGLGLYKNQLFDEGEATPNAQRALGNITNLKNRGKTFDHHFEMTDESPEQPQTSRQPVPESRQKAVKMMDANWSASDESPKQKENERIHIAGDGMGSKKDPSVSKMGYNRNNLAENKINIAGDGMGGKKGTNRDWLYGGQEGEDAPFPSNSRKGNATMKGGNAQSSLWDM